MFDNDQGSEDVAWNPTRSRGIRVYRIEIHLKGGTVLEIEAEDFDLIKLGPMHRYSGIGIKPSEKASQYLPYLDFDEVAAVKFTELAEDDRDENAGAGSETTA